MSVETKCGSYLYFVRASLRSLHTDREDRLIWLVRTNVSSEANSLETLNTPMAKSYAFRYTSKSFADFTDIAVSLSFIPVSSPLSLRVHLTMRIDCASRWQVSSYRKMGKSMWARPEEAKRVDRGESAVWIGRKWGEWPVNLAYFPVSTFLWSSITFLFPNSRIFLFPNSPRHGCSTFCE